MLVYVLLICVYVLIGMIFDAFMNGFEGSVPIFEPVDLAVIVFWPFVLAAMVVYHPFTCLYKAFFKLGRKAAHRKKAKRNN